MFRRYATAAALSLCAALHTHAQTGSFTPFNTLMGPDPFFIIILDMNDDGTAFVGSHGFGLGAIWTYDDGWIDLGSLPGGNDSSSGRSISADGSVVVGRSSGELHGVAKVLPFRWTSESGMIALPVPEGFEAISNELVSADGQVATGGVNFGFNYDRTYVWDDEGFFELPGGPGFSEQMDPTGISADGSVVVGTTKGGRAFRWTAATGSVALELAPGVSTSAAQACSYDGETIVGYVHLTGQSDHRPFIWTAQDGMSVLDAPLWEAQAISGDGLTVAGDVNDQEDVFVWREATGTFRLIDVLLAAGVEEAQGWNLTTVLAVSEDGNTLMGFGWNPDHVSEGWVATLPGPCLYDLNADYSLDLFDFLLFVNLFNTADPAADCDGSGALDLFDFLCFVDGFNAGC